jgi:ABC-type Fe3+-siderophore transport system permease subunit
VNLSGAVLAAIAIVGIGLGHIWVRTMEYHFGKRIWPLSMVIGAALVGASFFAASDFVSALLAIPGAIFLYAVKEFFEQERRVLKGHAPRNPKRRYPD